MFCQICLANLESSFNIFGGTSFLVENRSRKGEYKSNKSSSFQSCNSNAITSRRKPTNLNLCKLVISHINVNSLSHSFPIHLFSSPWKHQRRCIGSEWVKNKFDLLSEQIQENVDMLMIFETKIDDSFPIDQFQKRVSARSSDLMGIKMVMVFYLFIIYFYFIKRLQIYSSGPGASLIQAW